MAENILFVGWDNAKPGREKHSNELFAQFLGYLGKEQQKGNIDSFEPVILERHGGDLNGFVLIRGNRDKLHAMTGSDEWLNLIVDGNVTMDGFGVLRGYAGPSLQKVMGIWQSKIA